MKANILRPGLVREESPWKSADRKPRIWLLGVIPLLILGLALFGAEISASRPLQILAGIGLYLAVLGLLDLWLSLYELLVLRKELRQRFYSKVSEFSLFEDWWEPERRSRVTRN